MPHEDRQAISPRRTAMGGSHIAGACHSRHENSKQTTSRMNTNVGSVSNSWQGSGVQAAAADDHLETYPVESDDGQSTSSQQLYDEARGEVADSCMPYSNRNDAVEFALQTGPAADTDANEPDESKIPRPATRVEATNGFHEEGPNQETGATHLSGAQLHRLLSEVAQHLARLEEVEAWYLGQKTSERIDQLEHQQAVFSRRLRKLYDHLNAFREKHAALKLEMCAKNNELEDDQVHQLSLMDIKFDNVMNLLAKMMADVKLSRAARAA